MNVKLLLEKELWGLYNMVCEGLTGRLEVTSELLNILGLEDEVKLTSVDSTYFKEEYFATRPDSERLINMKLNARKMNIMRDWKLCLQEYIKDYYEGYL
jgi:dTDP-4-dehydrorhamnose reductase